MSQRFAACVILSAALLTRCGGVSGGTALLRQFADATCVVPSERDSDGFRVWRETVTTASGLSVKIHGMNDPTGWIMVHFGPGAIAKAVDPGDFFAPTEVCIDDVRGQLLVKAEGASAMGGGFTTWLHQYDLGKRELLKKVKIDGSKAPQRCPSQ